MHDLYICPGIRFRVGLSLSAPNECDASEFLGEFTTSLIATIMAIQRSLSVQQVNRKFYDYNGSLSQEDSGYYFGLQDHRKEQPLRDKLDLTGLVGIADKCDCQMRCGLPCDTQRWLPRMQPVQMPGDITLELLNKTIVNSGYSIRYDFKLAGPARMTIHLMPLEGVKMVDWSFLRGMLDSPAKYKPPYQITFTWGADSSPIEFYVELTVRITQTKPDNITCVR